MPATRPATRPVSPGELLTIESLLAARPELSIDTVYDMLADDSVLGRPLGFKIGRRWFIHPDDWAAWVDVRRGVTSTGSPNAPAGSTSRRAS